MIQSNPISKKYFTKKIIKDYKNFAFTTILEHEKLENNSAIQVFTSLGPIAFLPISNKKTSVVCSLDTSNKNYNDNEILKLINKSNPKFKVKKNSKINLFCLEIFKFKKILFKGFLPLVTYFIKFTQWQGAFSI